jgi:hypothetical protein
MDVLRIRRVRTAWPDRARNWQDRARRLNPQCKGAFDGTADALTALRTPIFLPAPFVSGNTQYGDAVMRGEFWRTGGSGSNYHVLLGQPQILPAVEIDVPADKGTIDVCTCGDPIHDTAILDDHWFLNEITRVINTSGVQPEALAIVLTHRVNGQSFSGIHGVLTSSDHGGGHQKIQTYIEAEFKEDASLQLGGQFLTNTHYALVLSHEVAEWLNDPFGANTVPNWISPFAPSAQAYGCLEVLEVGDPLISQFQFLGGAGKNDNSAVQDAAFFSWFSRQVPSIGIKGQYSLFNSLSAPPQTCSPASRSLLD